MNNQKTLEAALTVARARALAKANRDWKVRAIDGIVITSSSLVTSTAVEYTPETKTFVVNTNMRLSSLQLVDKLCEELCAVMTERVAA